MFRLLAYTGMRKGEALSLTWADIDFNNKTVLINKALSRGKNSRLYVKPPKTGETRRLTIDKKTNAILKKWRLEQKELFLKSGINTSSASQLVFTNNQNKFLQPTKTREWILEIQKKNHLKKITTHGLRHTHCSLLFESGASLKEVQKRLGHADIQTTLNIYTHVTEETQSETVNQFADYLNS